MSNLISANKEELESLQGRITAKNPADEARQLRIRKAGLEKLKGEFAIEGDGNQTISRMTFPAAD